MVNVRIDGSLIQLILEDPKKANELMGSVDADYKKIMKKVKKILSHDKVIEVDPRLETDGVESSLKSVSDDTSSSNSLDSGKK